MVLTHTPPYSFSPQLNTKAKGKGGSKAMALTHMPCTLSQQPKQKHRGRSETMVSTYAPPYSFSPQSNTKVKEKGGSEAMALTHAPYTLNQQPKAEAQGRE
jgi:hypothetical protein